MHSEFSLHYMQLTQSKITPTLCLIDLFGATSLLLYIYCSVTEAVIMSTTRELLNKWIGEYCAPVVVTATTAEAEKICLKNGLLFHELLCSFGHLDGVNATVRSGNQAFNLPDAHIRFERATELRAKSGENIEELLNKSFEEYDMSRIAPSASELRINQPTAWKQKIEQIVMRSTSFSEYEMLSHPVIILTVVATTDSDHAACMQELASQHHMPACLANGQYDPNVQRMYVLLDDASENVPHVQDIFRRLQTRYPAGMTKMLTVNSLPPSAPNLHQPDMWSRYLIPRFFPQHAPLSGVASNLPKNPVNGEPVVCARLSMEDFMALREFCFNLFSSEIAPILERRLATLNKQVSDNRKGVKNVLKSFWRKPKEDEGPSKAGGAKYKYDKIESQILLLADTSFIVKDYETASAMYKLVRDDFRSDKSYLHMAHCSLMLAACQMITEPNRLKDLQSVLDSLNALTSNLSDAPHALAYYSLMSAEMLVHNQSSTLRAPLEAARVLLAAVNITAGAGSKYNLLSGLLTERAAGFYMMAGQSRKFIFYEVLAGNRFHRCGIRPAKHAAVCFVASMLILDNGCWGDLKSKLCRALAADMKFGGRDGAQRSLLLMLKVLSSAICNEGDQQDIGADASLSDATNVLMDIIEEGAWGSIYVDDGWKDCTTRQIMLGTLPIQPLNILDNDIYKSRTEVSGLAVPELEKESVSLVCPVNGSLFTASLLEYVTSELCEQADHMRSMLELEVKWAADQETIKEHKTALRSGDTAVAAAAAKAPLTPSVKKGLSDRWVENLEELARLKSQKPSGGTRALDVDGNIFRIGLGEEVVVCARFCNRLPIDLHITKLKLDIEPADEFQMKDVELVFAPEIPHETILSAKPLQLGKYNVGAARWNLSDFFGVRQSLQRDGLLLQKTLAQRLNKQRAEDKSLFFEVVPEHPLLCISFEGLSSEVLQGQFLRASLVLKNEGFAPACDIYIKTSQPSFVFYLAETSSSSSSAAILSPAAKSQNYSIPFCGRSCTVVHLPEETVIMPGEELRLDAWLRIVHLGPQKISLFCQYKALRDDGNMEVFGPGTRCRSSFVSVETCGLPALGLSLRIAAKPSSAVQFTLIAEIANLLADTGSVSAAMAGESFGHGSSNSNSDSPAGRRRLTSHGQLDLSSLGVSGDPQSAMALGLPENSVRVVGVWMLGGAVGNMGPAAHAAASTAASAAVAQWQSERNNQAKAMSVAPEQTAVECFPIVVTDPTGPLHDYSKEYDTSTSTTVSHGAHTSWLLPIPNTTTPTSEESKRRLSLASAATHAAIQSSQYDLINITERFLCMGAANEQFSKEISRAWKEYEERLKEQDEQGPRTISQLRRDNQGEDVISGSAGKASTELHAGSGLLFDQGQDDLDESMERQSIFEDLFMYQGGGGGGSGSGNARTRSTSGSFSAGFASSRGPPPAVVALHGSGNVAGMLTIPPRNRARSSSADDKETTSTVGHDNSNNNANSSSNNNSASIASHNAREVRLPSSAADVAQSLANKHSVTVAFIWLCVWQGKVRWGIHSLSGISFITPSSTISSAQLKQQQRQQFATNNTATPRRTSPGSPVPSVLNSSAANTPSTASAVAISPFATLASPLSKMSPMFGRQAPSASAATAPRSVSPAPPSLLTPNQAAAATQSAELAAATASPGPHAVDFVLVGFSHVRTATLQAPAAAAAAAATAGNKKKTNSESSASDLLMDELDEGVDGEDTLNTVLPSCTVSVHMNMKSVSDQVILITVEGIDSQSALAHENIATTTTTSASGAAAPPPLTVAVPQVSFSGFRWDGKTKFSDVVLQPHAELSITFSALITQPGVYDLKRFKLLAMYYKDRSQYLNLSNTHTAPEAWSHVARYKKVSGQCIVEVFDTKNKNE